MTRERKVKSRGPRPIRDPKISYQRKGLLALDLEELDHRLEASLLSMSDFHADDPCIWACACFLVDGSEG